MFECVGAACICVYVAPVVLFAIGAFYNSFVMQKLVECVPRLDGGLNKGPCCCSFFFFFGASPQNFSHRNKVARSWLIFLHFFLALWVLNYILFLG